MKNFIFLSLLCLVTLASKGQEHPRAVGIRGGFSSGFEYRAYANELNSYKVLLSTRNRGIQLTGLKEFHQPGLFDFTDQLNFIYGYGIHVGYERWNAYDPYETVHSPYYFEKRSGPVVGLDGLGALEYTFWEVPISVGFEVKPYFNLFGKNFFQLHPFDFAFTVKYVF
ncbi:hypothetical protein ACUNWD_08465 [Sunxiuqinia sp. A32]|uniref:hypothetical protein n=1 Tax=Sunxiuqinia sp. A32 TaxID=3461496 RepID=UPI0040464DB8